MAKTQGQLDNTFWNLQRQSPAKLINVSQNQTMGFVRRRATRRTKERLRAQSPLKTAGVIWAGLTDLQRNDWSTVAQAYALTGWQLFVQRGTEQQLRGPTELGAYSYAAAYYGYGSDEENNNPGEFANYKAGHFQILSNPGEIILQQNHPQNYNIRRRIPQSLQVFETVSVEEQLLLPLTIGVSYRTMMEEAGASPNIEFYARIEYDDGGSSAYDEQGFTLELEHGWTRETLIITSAPGDILGYSLCFRFTDVIGDIAFDNIESTHTATNWAIDPFCNDVAPVYLPQWGDINHTWASSASDTEAILRTVKIDDLTLE